MLLLVLSSTTALAALAPTASASVSSTAHRVVPALATTASADAFVTRSGSQLQLNGSPWRFSGVDMYWLGLDDNVQDANGPTYPTHARIDDGFAGAAGLGARLVRAHTLGISVGSPRSLEPTLGHFNDTAFDSIDYSVYSARQHGIRLMIPLTDQWHYYHGGKHTFTAWRGHADLPGQTAASSNAQKATEALFYTDPTIINDFHTYVAHLLDHVNPYTGLRLGDDPTVAIWETGNELWDAPPSWTEQTAKFIKSHAPNALVADGSAATGMHVSGAALSAPDVDVVGGHFYPTDAGWAATDAQAAARAGKAYVIGEYPLTGNDAASWLAGLAANPAVAGDLAWTLLPHLADGQPEPHGDGYTFYFPGATQSEVSEDALLAAHMRAMNTGSSAPHGPANLIASAAVASTSDLSRFASGSTGTATPAFSFGVALGTGHSLRATMKDAGYTWIYPGNPTDGAPVTSGGTYTASLAARLPAGHLSPAVAAAHLSWYDAMGRWLAGTDGPSTPLIAGSWVSLTVTGPAPAGAAYAVPQWQTPQPVSAGDIVDLGDFDIARGSSALPWREPGT